MADTELSPPDDAYVRSVCRPGEGKATCRYLTMAPTGWSCAKHTSMADYLDERVAANTINAQGDNCDGMGSR